MIVGVDHLALSCDDVDAAGAVLRRAGFREAFVERGLPNAAVKGLFVHELHPAHSIGYYEAGGGTPLELTHYGGPVAARPAHYVPLLAAPPGGQAEDGDWSGVWAAAGYGAAGAYAWPELGATVWALSSSGPPAVRAVLSPAADLGRAVAFWTAVGCRPVAEGAADGRGWARLAFGAPLPAWKLELVVAEGDPRSDSCLDDRGFPCLAFLCTSLERDGETLVAAGALETSGRFDVTVNGRALAVAFFRGPEGELLELVDVRRDVG